MRLLYCTTGLDLGGAETQAVELALRMRTRGHAVHFVSMTPIQSRWANLEENGVTLMSLEMRRKRPTFSGFIRFIYLWRSFRPDVVHAHMFHANILVRIARIFGTRAAVICTAHSINEGGLARTIAYRLTDRLATITTIVSLAAAKAYIRKGVAPPGRIVYIPNGIDLAKFSPDPEKRLLTRRRLGWRDEVFIWLAVGRLSEAKDYPSMLDAFSNIQSSMPDFWHLAIVGDGPLRKQLQDTLSGRNLSKNVSLMGSRSDVSDLMNAADGFVMSSAWEGLPIVLLESSATGLPIVATRVGGVAEIVRDNESGILVAPKTSAALEGAITKIMSIPVGDRLTMGEIGRQSTKSKFAIQAVADIWESAYMKPAALAEKMRKPSAT